MKLVKPHLPGITHDLTFEFDAQDRHPTTTHDMEFDIPLEMLERNRDMGRVLARTSAPILTPPCAQRGVALIPKPQGEPNRPGSTGYNLKQTLNWRDELFSEFQKFTHDQCNEFLDNTKPMARQDASAVKRVCDLVKSMFSELERYDEDWPTRALIKMRLKAQSEAAKKKAKDSAIGKARAALATTRREPGGGRRDTAVESESE